MAIGYQSIAIGKKSIAIGWDSVASEPGVVSFGHKANDVSGYTVTWTQRTDKDSAGNIIKNADGTTNDYTKAPTITATTYSSDSYNRLVNVADGEDDHDVATVGQLNKKLDADASNVDLDAWAKKLGTGKIASGDTGLVTGGAVYTEVRPTTDGNYVHTAFTTAANLKALDTQVKGNADHISTINTTLSGLGSNYSKTDLSNLNDNGKATIRDLSKSAVKVVNGKNTKVRTGESGDATTYAVDVDTDAVTDTVKAGMKTELDAKANVDASNIDAGVWATKLGTGTIASGNTGLVTGGTVYTEVRPATDGNYVHTAFTTAANLKALDTQVKGNADYISTINTTLSGLGSSYSKTDLSNLNDTGKATIRDLSKSAVKVVDGKNTKVTTGKSGDATTYAVDVDTDAVTNTVKAGMKTELDAKANVNASNIDAGVWATKLGTGTIASGNTGLVTGGTVYTEVRPTTDGNYIHTASTTAANLKALDMQVKGNANSISTINTTVDNLNNTVSNLSTTGFSGDMKNKKITNLADGTDKKDAVNKSQMDKADADTLRLAKTYTNTAVNTAKDAAIDASKNYTDKTVKKAFEQSKKYTDEKVSNINNSIKNLQDSDGLNVKYTDNTKKNVALNNAKIQNLGSGNIKDGSTDAVNGGDVYKYVKDHANGGVEVDDKGNSVVNKNFIVNGDTTIKGDTNLQNTTVNKKLTVAGDTDLQNTTVNQKLTVNGDTNLQNTTVNQKLTVNGDTNLQNTTVNKNLTVSGDTDLQNTTVNKNLTVNGYTTLGQTTINKQLAVQGNTYISQNLAVGGNATVAQNLVVGNTIAAKQVVADDAIIGGHSVIDEFNRQREDTDRVGAGAAALAALQYLPYEDGSKLVGGAGYGHYRGKNAGAVGLRYYPNRDVAFSMASTVGNGDTMLNAGVSFRIGSGTGSVHSIPDTNKVLKETQALNKALAERLDKVEKELKQSNDTNEELMKRLVALEAKMK